ncbi:MAG: heparinase II/III family protein [Planctomycetota bacterium]|nr:heparinase II/III family protein [Planctomycetota bacterium]
MPTRLAEHPRLYASREQLERLREPAPLPMLAQAARRVAKDAAGFTLGERIDYDATTHNAHLWRARFNQQRVVALLVERFRTGQRRFRDAAVRHLCAMDGWPHWSWIAERAGKNHPNDIFDLSYGENAATMALGFDWLFYALSDEERARIVDIARRRALIPFLKNTEKKNRSWWYGKPDTNWNTVCAGGAGMLALAMYEFAPEAREAVARAEESVGPFMRLLKDTQGGWPEGLGYWNYGMRYAFMYLLSHERATGRRHPLLAHPSVKASLYFPLQFCPRGVPASFGDINQWSPLPFHYAAAERLGARDLPAELDKQWPGEARSRRDGPPDKRGQRSWPDDAELLILHPRKRPPAGKRRSMVAKRYAGLDWCALADRWPDPDLFLAIRGGTTEVPHGHRDLLSFHLHAGGERMISNLGCEEYLDTTFSERRYDLFETTPPSKNTILLNGVGITGKSTVKTELVRRAGLPGVRIDATEAMGGSRDGRAALFCGRLFLLLSSEAALIVDRVETRFPARMETRMHTHARVKLLPAGADLRGKRARLGVAYACDVPAVLCTAAGAPTAPGKAATMLRWCTHGRSHTSVTFATLLARGRPGATVAVTSTKTGIEIAAFGKRIRLGRRL